MRSYMCMWLLMLGCIYVTVCVAAYVAVHIGLCGWLCLRGSVCGCVSGYAWLRARLRAWAADACVRARVVAYV